MPNWCANDGWISPRTEEGKQIFEKLKQFKGYDEAADPNKTKGFMSLVLPRPDEM